MLNIPSYGHAALVMALLFGLGGCGDTCQRWGSIQAKCRNANYAKAERDACRESVALCSEPELERLQQHLDCLEQEAECKNGEIGNFKAAEQCFAVLAENQPACDLQ